MKKKTVEKTSFSRNKKKLQYGLSFVYKFDF